ncbi:MAG: septation protein SpoVG family protein [Candidatus Omnitrophica bacterium]|nr:septation protein SpoVG family protein [Candidatus Omnitrophota bacterium]
MTEVRIFLKDGSDKKLKAYATVTFDNAFVVRNIKIIEGQKGLFVAMPSRKLKESCPKCNFKNAVRSKFCNNCGSSLPMTDRRPMQETTEAGAGQKDSEHRDIAHPITLECREYLQKKILDAYSNEKINGPATPVQESAHAVQPQPQAGQPSAVAPAVAPKVERREEPKVEKREEKKSLEGDLEF